MAIKRDKLKKLSISELQELKSIAEKRVINRPIDGYSQETANEYKNWRNFNELLQCVVREMEERVINEYFE